MYRPSSTRAALVVSALFVSGLGGGMVTGVAAIARAQDPYTGLDRFARVLTVIEREYVDPTETPTLVDAAIEGMVDALDPQSRWLSADEVTSLREDTAGETTGIGVELRPAEGGVAIDRVLPGSPAERDGLQPGDRIVAIDGEPVAGLAMDDILERFHRERGVAARLAIQRPGWDAPHEVATTHDRIAITAVEGALLADDIGYVRLVQFQEGAARDLGAEIHLLEGQAGGRLAGLLLDLRDNPGGLLSEAVAVSDLFLESGPIVSTRGRAELRDLEAPPKEAWEATPGGWPRLPVVVVVNGGSASASEIVAAALQDSRRARLVGTRTYGKGTIQQLYRHTDGSAIKLTVGRYFTASGEPVADRQGRAPDIEVPWNLDRDPRARLVARLRTASIPEDERAALLSLADEIPAPDPEPVDIAWDRPPAERLAGDPQVQAAVAALRGR
jgi:carboxyl-terminal processing protease